MNRSLSWWISVVLNPNALQLTGALLWPFSFDWAYSVLAWVFLLIIPISGYLYYTRRYLKKENLLEISSKERLIPFAINISCLLTFYFIFPSPYIGFVLFMNVAAMLITIRYRISLHVASIAGLFGFEAFLGYYLTRMFLPTPEFYLFLAAIPLIWWARRRQKAHSIDQLLAGLVLGLIMAAGYLAVLIN